MSNGDSLDGFVFPPFIPPAAARPVDSPPPAPQSSVTEQPATPADAQAAAPARPTLAWDVETPIVGEAADVAPHAHTDEAEDEDLPWLERPAPRAAVADTQPATPAQEPAPADDDFPDWLAWDDRDADEARGEAEGVSAMEGLEDFVPADDLGSHFSPAPAVDWTEAEPVADAAAAADAGPGAPVTDDPGDSSAWSLDAPEGAEPPAPEGTGAAAVTVEEPSAAAEPEPVAAGGPQPEPEPLGWEPPEELAQPIHVQADSGPAYAAGGAFADVADRLEDIARALRERPDELLGGNVSDPLALLVTGYVMGYRARGGR